MQRLKVSNVSYEECAPDETHEENFAFPELHLVGNLGSEGH